VPPAVAQDYKEHEAFHSKVGGVYIRVVAATDMGLQIDAGRPPDHVLLAPILPEAATAWVDSAIAILDAPDSIATAGPITLSSGMLVDSAHDAASLDRVVGGPSPHCALFLADGENRNHVQSDLTCAEARQMIAALRACAAKQLAFDRDDSASTAAVADRNNREITRRQDSLAFAARAHFKKDSAAGAVR
jgi:hypothetical protein